MECRKLLYNNISSGGGEPGVVWVEVATNGDSLGSLSEILQVLNSDVSILENETVIAEFLYIANTSGRNVQLAVRLTEGSSTNSLFSGAYRTSSGEELYLKLMVQDNSTSKLKVELYKNDVFIENVGNPIACAKGYCAISRVTPATGNVKVKKHLV